MENVLLNGQFTEEEWMLYQKELLEKIAYPPESLEKEEHHDDDLLPRKEDLEEAWAYLTSHEDAIQEDIFLQVGNLVSKSHPYISEGYRKFGTLLQDTKTEIPPAALVPTKTRACLETYKNEKTEDPFQREANFFLAMIRIHPFEDGNRRTALLFVNASLLKQKIAPVIITKDIEDRYLLAIHQNKPQEMREIFRMQSLRESKQIRLGNRGQHLQTRTNRK